MDIEVDFSTSAKIREIASCLEVGSSGVGIQLIHFFLRFSGKSALVKHLEASSGSALTVVCKYHRIWGKVWAFWSLTPGYYSLPKVA